MNFSAIPQASAIGRLLRLPLRFIPEDMVIPILQGPLQGKKWIAGSSDHRCWLGSYEYMKQKLFQSVVTPGHVIYDIGANVGFYTLLSSVLVGEKGKVIAFEPLASNAVTLVRHLRLNNVKNASVIR